MKKKQKPKLKKEYTGSEVEHYVNFLIEEERRIVKAIIEKQNPFPVVT